MKLAFTRRWLLQLAILFTLALSLSHLLPSGAQAAEVQRGYVTLENETKIYVEMTEGRSNQPVFVLLNGLIYDMRRWDKLSAELVRSGATVINYAYSGQPENLRLLKEGEEPAFFETGLDTKDLALELKMLLKALQIKEKVNVVGLSYGATVAAELGRIAPTLIENTILMVPLVVPLDNYRSDTAAFRAWLMSIRFSENYYCDTFGYWNPWLCMYRDHWYDAFYNHYYETFLREQIQNVPAGVDSATFKKSVFHLVRAARDFDLKKHVGTMPSVHMMLAGEDEELLLEDQYRVWTRLSEENKRSLVVFKGAAHALPDVTPRAAAQWLMGIGTTRPELQEGGEFTVEADARW